MSVFDSIAGFFYPTDDALAQGRELDSRRDNLVLRDYQPGGRLYNAAAAQGGTDAADKNLEKVLADYNSGNADALDRHGQEIYDDTHQSDSGLGALLKDVFLLAAIGAAVWAFNAFGGLAWLKEKSGKVKWLPWAIVAGVVIGAWFVWSRLKKTKDDAGNFVGNLGSSFKTIFS
jgi:hypothetical protein